jgi:hypothetical protein
MIGCQPETSEEPKVKVTKQEHKKRGVVAAKTCAHLEASADKIAAKMERCKKILVKSWEAIQPALKKLKVDDLQLAEKEYLESKAFLDQCVNLGKQHLKCLEESENPVSGINICEINDRRKPAEKLVAPLLRDHIGLFSNNKLKKKAARKMLAGLKGKWVNNWRRLKQKTSWRVDKKGRVTELTRHGKSRPQKKNFSVSFESSGKLKIKWSKSSSQDWVFFRQNKKTFYASGNQFYGAYPIKNRRSFVVQNSHEYIFFRRGKCEVVSDNGLMTEAPCQFFKKGKKKLFKISYQFVAEKMPNGLPKVHSRTYQQVGNYLLQEGFVESGKFVRK